MTDSFTAFLYDTLENTRNENFAHPNPEYSLPAGKVACPRSVVLCDSGRLAGFGAAIMTSPSMRRGFKTLAHTSGGSENGFATLSRRERRLSGDSRGLQCEAFRAQRPAHDRQRSKDLHASGAAKQRSFLADHAQSEAQRNCDFADRQG